MLRILLCLASIPEDNDIGRSDALMILSIDRVHNKNKINLYCKGIRTLRLMAMVRQRLIMPMPMGALRLAIKTINENFDMNIQGLCNSELFPSWRRLIDYLGGINIAVTEEERGLPID